MYFQVNNDLCKRDRICVDLCPASIIKLDDDKYPFIADSSTARCIKCGQCVSFCPHNAIALEGVSSEAVNKELMPSAESAVMFLKSRRSIRKFRKDGLSRDAIEELMAIMNTAPTAANQNMIRWIVLDKRDMLDRAANLIVNFMEKTVEGPGVDSRMAVYFRAMAKMQRSGRDFLFRGAPQLIIAVAPASYEWKVEDGSIALTYLELAAHAKGAGMCWAGYFTNAARNYAPLREFLGVAEDEYVVGAQMLGIPALGIPKRVPLKHGVNFKYLNSI